MELYMTSVQNYSSQGFGDNIAWTTTSNDSLSSWQQTTGTNDPLISEVEKYIEFTIISTIALLGAINNLIILLVASWTPILRQQSHLLVVNLALVDFIVTAIFCPIYAVALLKGEWPFSDSTCVFIGGLLGQNTGVSMLTNFAIALNRCILAQKRHKIKHMLCNNMVIMAGIATIWIFVFVVLLLPALTGYIVIAYNPFCNCCIPSFVLSSDNQWTIFNGYVGGITLLIPFCGSIVCYFFVYKAVRKSYSIYKSVATKKRHIRTSKNMAIIFLVFAVCWLPDQIHLLVDPHLDKIPPFLTRGMLFLALSNSAVNPFIFALKFPAFNEAVRQFIFRQNMQMLRRQSTFMVPSRKQSLPQSSNQATSYVTAC